MYVLRLVALPTSQGHLNVMDATGILPVLLSIVTSLIKLIIYQVSI